MLGRRPGRRDGADAAPRRRRQSPPSRARRRSRTAARAAATAERGVGGEQVEGRQAVRELLLAGTRAGARGRGRRRAWTTLDGRSTTSSSWPATPRVPVRTVGRGQARRRARTEAPQGVIAQPRRCPRPTSTTWPPPGTGGGRRSSSPSTASPTPATSAPCCARPSAPASPASCCPGTGPSTSRRRSPRRPPAPSSTCRSPWSAGCPPPSSGCRQPACGSSASTPAATRRSHEPAARRRARRARARGRGRRAVPPRPPALRRRSPSIPLRGRLGSLNVAAAGGHRHATRSPGPRRRAAD